MSIHTHIIVSAHNELWAMPSFYAHSAHYTESLVHIPFKPQQLWDGMGLIEGQAHVVISLQNYVIMSAAESMPRPIQKRSWLVLLAPTRWRACLGVDRIVGYAEDLAMMAGSPENLKAKSRSHWKGAPVWVLDVELLLKAFNLSDESMPAALIYG